MLKDGTIIILSQMPEGRIQAHSRTHQGPCSIVDLHSGPAYGLKLTKIRISPILKDV